MKILRADGSAIEGTPEEIVKYEELRSRPEAAALDVPRETVLQTSAVDDWEYASSEVAFRALTRVRLGNETKVVLKRLYDAGDSWTSAASLQKEIGYRPSQFAGLMGAFGRRLVNTPGYVANSAFFNQEWDADQSCYLYRLPPSVRAAVAKARIAS